LLREYVASRDQVVSDQLLKAVTHAHFGTGTLSEDVWIASSNDPLLLIEYVGVGFAELTPPPPEGGGFMSAPAD
jgi:hypothetical protein